MLDSYVNCNMFYEEAASKLPADIFSFIDSGSFDELARKRNGKRFDDILLKPRVLRGINEPTTKASLFNHDLNLPALIAPAAYQCLLSENGELDMLSAAEAMNSIMILSMFSSIDYATVTKHKQSPVWLQMYLLKDRTINENFINLANDLNFDAIVLTVDAPVYAKKDRERLNPLQLPEHLTFDHLKQIGIPIDECRQGKRHLSTLLDPTISWDDLDWVAGKTNLPIILKGIIDPRDTQIALQYPAVKGLVISNHGGRQLDSCLSPIDIMQAHKNIVNGRVKLFLDGGITRGSDIFKALALGADATLIGRTMLWALSAAGRSGVITALDILQQELLEVMTLCGCESINDITPEHLIYRGIL